MALSVPTHAPAPLRARVEDVAAISVMSFMSFETFGGP